MDPPTAMKRKFIKCTFDEAKMNKKRRKITEKRKYFYE